MSLLALASKGTTLIDTIEAASAMAGAAMSAAESIPFLGAIVEVINKVEELKEEKASNDQLAELVKTICESVKATLLSIKKDADFMGSKDMSAFKSLADTILKASRFIYEYLHKHWFLRYR